MTTLAAYNRRAVELDGKPKFRGVVISVHGINTTGPWQKHITPILQKHSLLYVPVDYGFAKSKILRPRKLLRRACEELWRAYEQNQYFHSELPFCAIGHSYGTLAIGCLIENNRDACFSKIILAGSILREDFPWGDYIDHGQVDGVLNEIAKNDWVVKRCRFLKAISPRLPVGCSGVLGFSCIHDKIRQRDHTSGHSGVLNQVACNKVWVPFLLGEPAE